ncbi:MAG: hypothetical protein U0V74_01960 [Chitinophagales bacterium]
MPNSGDTKRAPCNGSEKCRKLKYTKWVYKVGWLGNYWKCMTCGTER